jgi:hypothetical protein
MNNLQQKPMTEREQRILRILEIFRGNYLRDATDERHPEKFREIFSSIGHAFDEAIGRIKKELEEKP